MVSKKNGYYLKECKIISSLFFVVIFMTTPVLTDSGLSPPTPSYFPSIPLDGNVTWKYHLNMSGGYPLVPHEFGSFTNEDWATLDEDQNQTVTMIHYFNSPDFPNETVYGFFHHELRFVLWIKEIRDEMTDITSLSQVGESVKDTYNSNMSPSENDYLGNIEWLFVHGRLYPRTWIKGNMSAGMNWTEYWGPFTMDKEGSVFRERQYSVQEYPISIQNQNYTEFAVNIIGPGEDDENEEIVETLYFVEGIGPTGRDITAKTTLLTPLPPVEGWPSSIPANTMILNHSARIVSKSG